MGEPSAELRRRLRSHMRFDDPVHPDLTALTYLSRMEGCVAPGPQTPWQEIQRNIIDQVNTGAVLKLAVHHQRITQKFTTRHSH